MDKTKISLRDSFRARVNYHQTVTYYQPSLRMRLALWIEMRVQAFADYWRERNRW
jgi:hypothetical protein